MMLHSGKFHAAAASTKGTDAALLGVLEYTVILNTAAAHAAGPAAGYPAYPAYTHTQHKKPAYPPEGSTTFSCLKG